MPKAQSSSSSSSRGPSVPLLCYEELLDGQVDGLPFRWPELPEDTPCGLCYTSGTTGNPKVGCGERSGEGGGGRRALSESQRLNCLPWFHDIITTGAS